MKQVRNDFGQALRALRKRTKTRIETISNEMQWSKSYLMDLEMGRSSPPHKDKIAQLCKLMGALDEYVSMLEKAAASKEKVTLSIQNPIELQTAALLARDWGNLTDEQLQKIREILEVPHGQNHDESSGEIKKRSGDDC